MISKERALRMLTIKPTDLAMWTTVCRRVNKQVAAAHPEYPCLQDMQFLSYVKRLLPEIRAMITTMDEKLENATQFDACPRPAGR